MPAALLCRLDLSSKHTFRYRCTTQRCQAAPWKRSAIAQLGLSWASLVTHLTPETPRLRRSQQNPSYQAQTSVSMAESPTTRLTPSAPTATAVTAAVDCTRLSRRHFT